MVHPPWTAGNTNYSAEEARARRRSGVLKLKFRVRVDGHLPCVNGEVDGRYPVCREDAFAGPEPKLQHSKSFRTQSVERNIGQLLHSELLERVQAQNSYAGSEDATFRYLGVLRALFHLSFLRLEFKTSPPVGVADCWLIVWLCHSSVEVTWR